MYSGRCQIYSQKGESLMIDEATRQGMETFFVQRAIDLGVTMFETDQVNDLITEALGLFPVASTEEIAEIAITAGFFSKTEEGGRTGADPEELNSKVKTTIDTKEVEEEGMKNFLSK